jgi:flagellar hook-associated protein 2
MSNIDTDSIVSQLMAVERRPQQLLASNVTALQKSQSAWQTIADKLTALKTAADALAGMGQAATFIAATSSDPTAVAVRATGAAASATASVEVISLAAAHSVVSGDTFASTTDAAGARTLELTVGATTHTFTSGDGTVGGLAAAVNAAGIGIRATLLQTAPGSYQMVVTSTSTGAANAFTTGGTGWAGFTVARSGADAQLLVDGVSVSRSSNVITDVVDGLELTLAKASSGPVSVGAKRDDDRIASAVKAMVDAANAAMTTIANATKTSTDATTRGALAGDYTARRLADSIRSIIASPLTGSGTTAITAGSMGVSLTREGAITLDDTKLRAALSTDAAAVLGALGRGATSASAGVSVVGSTSSATPGSRQVVVTQAATQATLAALPVPPPAAGTNISMNIVTPQGTFLVAFEAGASWAESAGSLNAALRAAGVHLVASASQSGGIDLAADRYGSAGSFSVTGGDDVGLVGSATGVDAQGTIGGTAFTATGRTVTSGGIVYSIDATATDLATAGGSITTSVTFTDGLAGALSRIGNEGSSDGAALTAKTALADRIANINDRIARYDDQLALREATLRRKFTAMETMLAQLQSVGASLGYVASTPSTSS